MTFTNQPRSVCLVWVFLLIASIAACSDESARQPDGVVYESEMPLGEFGIALVEVDDGVLAIAGQTLVHVAKATNEATVIQVAAGRFHSSLVADDNYVYFATQRLDSDFHGRSTSPNRPPASEPHGHLFRVGKRPPFKPEKLQAVDILMSRLHVADGQLEVCSSLGQYEDGKVLVVPTASPTTSRDLPVGPRKYCEAVISDRNAIYAVVEGSIYEEGRSVRELTRLDDAGRVEVALRDHYGSVRGLALRNDELVLLGERMVTFVSKEGLVREWVAAPTGGALGPHGDSAWIWTKRPSAYQEGGKVCVGGGVYVGPSFTSGRELARDTCAVWDFVVGTSDLWFIEYARDEVERKNRFRVRRVAPPTP